MDFQEFDRQLKQAAHLHSSGKYKEAEEAYYSLYMSEIADLDKAAICLKLAVIQDRIGNSDEVLAWFDKAIAYEQPLSRFRAAVEKAHYLSELGRSSEAVPIYESLLKQPYLTEAEREAFRRELKALLSRSIGEWK